MISRRNIRVKVMQTIYTLSTIEGGPKPADAVKLLQKHFDASRDLLFYITYFLTEVAGYVEKDAYQRSSKHLPTAEDLNVNTKLAGNTVRWRLKEDPSFAMQYNSMKPASIIDGELVRKLYLALSETPEYKKYIGSNERSATEERSILEFILTGLLLKSEPFISHIEENFMNWDDDNDMVLPLLGNLLQKQPPQAFREVISPDKWAFAKELLQTVLEKEEHLQQYIVPKLKNWDVERIAALDMIIMKMGVTELLYFDTIPPKVSINEYIDIAKEYSTQQSGQFVNGILDGIHKDLVREGGLHKTDFKKA